MCCESFQNLSRKKTLLKPSGYYIFNLPTFLVKVQHAIHVSMYYTLVNLWALVDCRPQYEYVHILTTYVHTLRILHACPFSCQFVFLLLLRIRHFFVFWSFLPSFLLRCSLLHPRHHLALVRVDVHLQSTESFALSFAASKTALNRSSSSGFCLCLPISWWVFETLLHLSWLFMEEVESRGVCIAWGV